MSSTDKYRDGYERAKADIEKTRNETLADMPENFVKGIASAPIEAIKDFFRNSDEDRGYRDGLESKDFDP